MKNKIVVLFGLIFLVFITSFLTQIVISNYGFIYDVNLGICTTEDMEFFNKFVSSKFLLKNTFYKEIDNDVLYEGALKGMVDAVKDPYTSYLDKDDVAELKENIEHEYDGIGVYLQLDPSDNTIKVIEVIKNTPAEDAGMLAGDKIIKVDGIEYTGEQIDDAVSKIKKAPGQKVKITVLRNSKEKELEVECRHLKLDTVSSEIKTGNVGYIEITEFGDGTAQEFKNHYSDLISKQIKGLIIDLRNNTGGVYEEVIAIAKEIVPKGLIVYTQDKNGNKEETFSEGEGIRVPLVVLINEYSASASEVLAGAIKDRECGILVGTKTYGKGVIQGVYNMPDGTSIKVTIAEYYTPNGVCIDGVGIEPNQEVKVTTNKKDEQLDAALKLINEKNN